MLSAAAGAVLLLLASGSDDADGGATNCMIPGPWAVVRQDTLFEPIDLDCYDIETDMDIWEA